MADFLREALAARLQGELGREVSPDTLDYLNPMSFLDEAGDFDADKVSTFAAMIGPAPQPPVDFVRAQLERSRPPQGSGVGSIEHMKQAAIEQMEGDR